MKVIYLIKELWMYPYENQPSDAVGYRPLGFVATEEEAIDFCAKGRKYTQSDCWAIYRPVNQYEFKELKNLKT